MRRADRLFRIVQCLRGGRLVTARELARQLEVSERTIYRDMCELMTSGVPVTGEAGVGYVLRGGFDIPPLMFSRDELEAVLVGVRMVQARAGAQLASSATEAMAKIEAVVPEALRESMARSRIFALGFDMPDDVRATLDIVHRAIGDKHVLSFGYVRQEGCRSLRHCQPLGLYFWGKVWTLAAWCELRDDFRNFRVDRMSDLRLEDRTFREEKGRTLADFLRFVRAEAE